MKKAQYVRHLNGFVGEARLYKLSEPLEAYGTDEVFTYVIVSGVVAYSGPETYIFPSNEEGKITDWGELHGSFRGEIDHVQALENAGYTVE